MNTTLLSLRGCLFSLFLRADALDNEKDMYSDYLQLMLLLTQPSMQTMLNRLDTNTDRRVIDLWFGTLPRASPGANNSTSSGIYVATTKSFAHSIS